MKYAITDIDITDSCGRMRSFRIYRDPALEDFDRISISLNPRGDIVFKQCIKYMTWLDEGCEYMDMVHDELAELELEPVKIPDFSYNPIALG